MLIIDYQSIHIAAMVYDTRSRKWIFVWFFYSSYQMILFAGIIAEWSFLIDLNKNN